MFGVVLWSDCATHKAVIWCEDHGELAYFDAIEHPGTVELALEPGDLVRFELCQAGSMRLVRNPSLVAEQQFPTLASDLKGGAPDGARAERAARDPAAPVPAARAQDRAAEKTATTAVIIPFVSGQRRRARALLPVDQRLTV